MTRMDANEDLLYRDEVFAIVGAAMEVHSVLGHGFLEAVYGDALTLEFELRGIPFEREFSIDIRYKDQMLPHRYRADFFVYGSILLELKAIRSLSDNERAQALNYLKATGYSLALLLNFGSDRLEWIRLVKSH
jgi:GxxExxY protein